MAATQPPQQLPRQLSNEVEKVIQNYQIIVKKAQDTDPMSASATTRAILNLIFRIYVPCLQEDFREFREQDPDIATLLDDFEVQGKTICDNLGDNFREPLIGGSIGPHESPLVLLLTLALENLGTRPELSINIDLPEDSDTSQNWGRLWCFREYLRNCGFSAMEPNRGTKYWPGLPHCIMTSLPLWTADVKKWRTTTQKLRKARLGNIEERCGASSKAQIRRARDFSRALARDDSWEHYLRTGIDQQIDPRNLSSCDIGPRHQIPIYLPVLACVWTPDGEYKNACLLDRLRFSFLRPPEAERQEIINREKERREEEERWKGQQRVRIAPEAAACAEWDGYMNIVGLLNGGVVSR
ncbi:hypothetical protein F5Y14DRAFT_455966 [Nemania sp. NC0429]|nr:hypothetical protein F5Y14DRAFT_455966 [Nemania sp. NC0429]